MSQRHYYRCPICLSTSTLEEKRNDLECICGGRIRCLGPVTDKGKWLKESLRPKCDGRCIGATGPNCDCQCHGENHGKGLEGCITVRTEGGAAVLRPVKPEEALRRAEEYRQARDAVLKAFADTFGCYWDQYTKGVYIPQPVWEAIRFYERQFTDAKALLTHRLRIERLNDLAQKIRQEKLYKPH